MKNGPANGLSHTWNAITATGQSSVTDSALTTATDTTAVSSGNNDLDTGQYAQNKTSTIAEFLEQRGVSIKEQLAVAQSGMTYNVETTEIELGIVRLKDAIQRMIFQGNAQASLSAYTGTSEYGLYNQYGFDGLRLILSRSGAGSYSNSAVQYNQDQSSKTILQACNTVTGRVINNGGLSRDVVLSATAHAALMDEQEGKQRSIGSMEIVPGLRVFSINTVAGELPLLPVPGLNAIGQYNRTSDGLAVEDIYVLDSRFITRRWLGSPDINVLELPAGISGALTRTFLIFHFTSLEVADLGLFQGKVRIPQTLV